MKIIAPQGKEKRGALALVSPCSLYSAQASSRHFELPGFGSGFETRISLLNGIHICISIKNKEKCKFSTK
jgi:hypothetical protein